MSNPTAPASTVDQDALDRALFQTLIIAAAVGVVFVIAFFILRRCAPRLYAPYLFKETPAGKKLVSFVRWFLPMFTVSDEYLFEHRGLDALMYMKFTKMMLTLMIAFFFFGTLILWPVDGTSSNKSLPKTNSHYVYGTAILTFSNISSERQKARYTAHLLSVLFNSILCYWLFAHVFSIYHRYSIRQWRKTDFSNYAIVVENISRRMSEEEIMVAYENQFPGQVLNVQRMMTVHDMHVEYLDRLSYDDLKEEARWNTVYSRRMHEKNPKKFPATETRPEIRNVKSSSPCCISLGCCCCCRPKVDQEEFADDQIRDSNVRIEKLESKLKPTQAAIITFKTRDAAAKASSIVLTRKRTRFYAESAPDFNDIRWHSFEYSHRNRNVRYGLILALVIIVGIIFFIPTTFAQGLANLSTLATIPGFGWVKGLTEKYPTTTAFVEGILPALVLTLAFVIVKIFLKKIVLLERYITRSNEFRSFLSKYFYILVLNVFLASIAAGTFITLYTSVRDIVNDPLSLIRLLAQRLPTQVNFFINYMAVNSVIMNLLPLLQPVRFLTRLSCKRIFKGKTWTQRNWMRQYNWFHYQEEYPIQMLYFTITIAYSSLAPLIVPFALICFAIKYVVGSYHTLYVFKRRAESFGRYWPSVFNRLCAGMVIYQALMTGIFALQTFVAGIIICAILMITTIIYAICVNWYYGSDLETRSVEIHDDFRKDDSVNLDVLADHYRDPMMEWRIINEREWPEAVWYNSRDRLRQLQLSVHHPEYFKQLQSIRMGYVEYTDSINKAGGIDTIPKRPQIEKSSDLETGSGGVVFPGDPLLATNNTDEIPATPSSKGKRKKGSLIDDKFATGEQPTDDREVPMQKMDLGGASPAKAEASSQDALAAAASTSSTEDLTDEELSASSDSPSTPSTSSSDDEE